jgi:ZIP family zinc transporter
LFSLLPEAKSYFLSHDYPPDKAGCAVIGFFLVGVLGIQVLSELLHRCLPSSIVSCEDHGALLIEREHGHHDTNLESAVSAPPVTKPPTARRIEDENTPLLERRPVVKNVRSFLAKNCATGKCYGYSDHPCDQFCSVERNKKVALDSVKPASSSAEIHSQPFHDEHGDHPDDSARYGTHSVDDHDHEHALEEAEQENPAECGHHHIPQNRFLTIGIQTSIAIALHKFPEVVPSQSCYMAFTES